MAETNREKVDRILRMLREARRKVVEVEDELYHLAEKILPDEQEDG